MDETLVGWVFLLAMLFWRSVTTLGGVQRCLHCLGPLAVVLQWYTLSFLGLFLLLARTFFDICLYDYFAYKMLTSDRIAQNFHNVCASEGWGEDECAAFTAERRIPNWLRVLSLAAPVCGVLAFAGLSFLLARFIRYNHYKEESMGSKTPWKLARRLEWVTIILGMPLVFITLSMRSLIRIWAVMTGSCWKPGLIWAQQERLELATYSMDLELGLTFQFYGILMFAFLCTSFLEHSKYIRAGDAQEGQRYMRTLAYASIQGVYAFVAVGVLRSIFDFAVTYLEESPKYKDVAQSLQTKVLGSVGIIFSFVTLLCMVNMVAVSKVRDMRDNLDNANLKFLGTRLLLLISQIQPQVLAAATVGSSTFLTFQKYVHKFELDERLHTNFEHWTFTSHQAKLVHVSLLNMEGLVVALLTMAFWQLDSRQRTALMQLEAERVEKGSGRQVAAREGSESGYMPLAASA